MTAFTWTVRVRADAGRTSTVYARGNAFLAGDALSFRPTDDLPSALELMLGAFAADLVATFRTIAHARRISIDALEFSANCVLNNPLIHVGVRGEEGHPGIERIEGTLYVSSDAEEPLLEAVWDETLRRSPLYNTLCSSVELAVKLSITA